MIGSRLRGAARYCSIFCNTAPLRNASTLPPVRRCSKVAMLHAVIQTSMRPSASLRALLPDSETVSMCANPSRLASASAGPPSRTPTRSCLAASALEMSSLLSARAIKTTWSSASLHNHWYDDSISG
ncbi:hypothetical protein ACXZ1M_28575 [Duganella sp. PWIR1]